MSRLATKTVQKIGDYVILERISQGSMGTVYKGRQTSTGNIVAIKLVSAQVVADEDLRLRFAQECQVARMLTHPHIVGMLDFGLDGDRPYLVMEYVEGESLRQRLDRDGPLPESEAVRLIRQVGEALQWAHEKKLVHRDVKPDNILVSTTGEAKLTDLGLAKNLETNLGLTRTNTFFGTPNFMAPEQFIDAKRADAQSDLYSLAATLYMVLTGQLPFDTKEGIVAVYQKKLANDIAPPAELVPELSDQVNEAIVSALRAERKERPLSVLDFVITLPADGASASTTAPGRRSVKERGDTAPKGPIPTCGQPKALPTALPSRTEAPNLRLAEESPAKNPSLNSGGEEAPRSLLAWLPYGATLLPGVLGIGAAVGVFHHRLGPALIAVSAGWGLSFLSLGLVYWRRGGSR